MKQARLNGSKNQEIEAQSPITNKTTGNHRAHCWMSETSTPFMSRHRCNNMLFMSCWMLVGKLLCPMVSRTFMFQALFVAIIPAHTSSLAVTRRRIAVVGGGASGMFSAISAAETLLNTNYSHMSIPEVVVFEGSGKTLTKVAISGGGRCNVLHDTSKATFKILEGYPRGRKELMGIYHKRFTPTQAREWFEERGVVLKTEADGRMFPVTDSSQSIVDVLIHGAEKAGAQVRLEEKITSIEKDNDAFVLDIRRDGKSRQEAFECVILATGSSPSGYQIAQHLGHSIVQPVPSLFTLNAKHQIKEGEVLHGLSGVSVKNAKLTFKYSVPGRKKKQTMVQNGPLLITHHGLSGPATLRLSAFGARVLHDINYRGEVFVHWAPELGTTEQIADALWQVTTDSPKRTVSSACPLRVSQLSNDEDNNANHDTTETTTSPIPRRLWAALVAHCGGGFERDTTWGRAKKKSVRALARAVSEFVVNVTGKGVFKEEFVKAGGVSLKNIDMKTMQSKKCEGLFFCGEVIDVDGITGGFNFMNCWSTGHVAGAVAAEYVSKTEAAKSAT